MDEISYSGAAASPKRKLPKRLILFIIFFLVIIALIAGVFYFVTRDSSETSSEQTEDALILPEDNAIEEITEEPTPTEEEEEETPTPTKEADEEESADTSNSSGSVTVQNGSGEAGVAGKASTALKEAGFSIASTGNADNFDYEGVTIQVKNSKKSILADLEDALSKDYTISDTSTDLPESTNYDALVIIGK